MDEEKEYIVTCRVENCGNSNFDLLILAPAINPFFLCGGCGQQITDVFSA